MGIKFFYKWLLQKYPECVRGFVKSKPPTDVGVDVFLIDMNGIFHNSAQRVFKYGNGASKSVLRAPQKVEFNTRNRLELFNDITQTIDKLVDIVKPTKTLVLAIDGVAPASKMNQQRQRRFKSSSGTDATSFNPIWITPGTVFMDNLSNYLDWHIRKKMSDSEYWGNLNVVFSSEKHPGEGEHKLIDYIRKFCTKDETFCINALDADLVMLSLATFNEKFYLLRDESYSKTYDYSYVSIGQLQKELEETMKWEGCGDTKRLLKDFILICFLCGNDFLPNIPSISILENGLDIMIDLYKSTKRHIIREDDTIDFEAFQVFLRKIGNSEEGMLVQKSMNRAQYIPDPLLDKHTSKTSITTVENDVASSHEIVTVNVLPYKEEYYVKKGMKCVTTACHSYLEGCQWVFTYYISGIRDWTWVYPYNYAPFAMEMSNSITGYSVKESKKTFPLTPFEQLLCVIPPSSASILPKPLNTLLMSRIFERFCPKNVVVNCEGKKFEYEGIVELPAMDIDVVKREYTKRISDISPNDMTRNIRDKAYIYKANSEVEDFFKSRHGDIKNYRVLVSEIEL